MPQKPPRRRTQPVQTLQPIAPPQLVDAPAYSTIRQGPATNTLTKMQPNARRNLSVDPVTGEARITQGPLSVTITDFDRLAGLRVSTYQLLDALTAALTQSGTKNPFVVLPLEEYMAKRGLKNKKETRKQVMEDLESLFNARISFQDNIQNSRDRNFHDIRILDSKGIQSGLIRVSFGTMFYEILSNYPIMPYPERLWTINAKHNPNSFYFLRKIAEHKNMNAGKKNEDILSVQTLLSATPNLPFYEEVKGAGRQVNQRIIEPFERDMDALRDTIKWAYCHSNNKPLTAEELENMDYDTFLSLLVKIDWITYPDQTARLEQKTEQTAQARQQKKPPRRKRRAPPADE